MHLQVHVYESYRARKASPEFPYSNGGNVGGKSAKGKLHPDDGLLKEKRPILNSLKLIFMESGGLFQGLY